MSDQEADIDAQNAKKRKRSGPKSRTSSFLGVTRVSQYLALALTPCPADNCFDVMALETGVLQSDLLYIYRLL